MVSALPTLRGTLPARWFLASALIAVAAGRVDTRVYSRAAALGKTVILWTLDPRDWSRPGTATIVSRVLNNVRPGSVILFHDGGGNRSQTVAALPAILKTLKARGYTFSREFWC
jgi:peptidoglycan/xylan/chitin deacetylase (PgdA/CDA1 family)